MKKDKIEPMKMAPTLYLDSKQLPEIKGWDVGDSYELTIKVKMVSLSETETGQSASFEITEINDNKLGEKSYSELTEDEESEGKK